MGGPHTDDRVARAEADVAQARAQLTTTFQTLTGLLAPRRLAHEAWESAKDKGAGLAEDAVDAVRKRPVAATGIIAALAMFLAREPLKDGISRLTARRTPAPAAPSKKSPAAPRRKPAPARRPKKPTTPTENQS